MANNYENIPLASDAPEQDYDFGDYEFGRYLTDVTPQAKEEPGVLSNIWSAIKSGAGSQAYDAAFAARASGLISDPDQFYKILDTFSYEPFNNEDMENFQNALRGRGDAITQAWDEGREVDAIGNFLYVVGLSGLEAIKNHKGFLYTMGEELSSVLSQQVPAYLAATIAAPVPVPGSSAAAFTGTSMLIGTMQEYASSVRNGMVELGLDPNQVEDIEKFYSDPSALEYVKQNALVRGVDITAWETLGNLVGGKLLKGIKRTPDGKLDKLSATSRVAGSTLVGGTADFTGEATAGLLTTGKADLGEAALEAGVGGPLNVLDSALSMKAESLKKAASGTPPTPPGVPPTPGASPTAPAAPGASPTATATPGEQPPTAPSVVSPEEQKLQAEYDSIIASMTDTTVPLTVEQRKERLVKLERVEVGLAALRESRKKKPQVLSDAQAKDAINNAPTIEDAIAVAEDISERDAGVLDQDDDTPPESIIPDLAAAIPTTIDSDADTMAEPEVQYTLPDTIVPAQKPYYDSEQEALQAKAKKLAGYSGQTRLEMFNFMPVERFDGQWVLERQTTAKVKKAQEQQQKSAAQQTPTPTQDRGFVEGERTSQAGLERPDLTRAAVSPQEAEFVANGVRGKTLDAAVDWIESNTTTPGYKEIANRVAKRIRSLAGMGMKFGFEIADAASTAFKEQGADANVAAMNVMNFANRSNRVVLKGPEYKGETGSSFMALLHEAIHAVTQYQVAQGKRDIQQGRTDTFEAKIYQNLENLMDSVGAAIASNPSLVAGTKFEDTKMLTEVTTDMDEFIGYGMSDPEFQAVLEQIPYQGKITGWDRFVIVLRKAMGMERESDSVLSELMQTFARMTDENAPMGEITRERDGQVVKTKPTKKAPSKKTKPEPVAKPEVKPEAVAEPEAKPVKKDSLSEYIESTNGTAIQKGKLKSVLSTIIARRSSILNKIYQGSRASVISEMVADGYTPNKEEVDAIKDVSRRQFNRMDGTQQREYERRKKEAGKKSEYTMNLDDTQFVVTQSEYEYAQWLLENREKPEVKPEAVAEPEAKPVKKAKPAPKQKAEPQEDVTAERNITDSESMFDSLPEQTVETNRDITPRSGFYKGKPEALADLRERKKEAEDAQDSELRARLKDYKAVETDDGWVLRHVDNIDQRKNMSTPPRKSGKVDLSEAYDELNNLSTDDLMKELKTYAKREENQQSIEFDPKDSPENVQRTITGRPVTDKQWIKTTRVVRTGSVEGAGRPIVVHFGGKQKLKGSNLFSNSPSTLREMGVAFDQSYESAKDRGANITSAYLNISNPITITDPDKIPKFATAAEGRAYKKKQMAAGKDGVIIDMRKIGGDVQYIVFSANQIMPVEGTPLTDDADIAKFIRSPDDIDRNEQKDLIEKVDSLPDDMLDTYTAMRSYSYPEQAKLQQLRDAESKKVLESRTEQQHEEARAKWRALNKQEPIPGRKEKLDEARKAAEAYYYEELSWEEFRDVLDIVDPVVPLSDIPEVPSLEDVMYGLDNNKVSDKSGILGYNHPGIKEGAAVKLRLDIPALDRYGVAVVTISGKGTPQKTQYSRTGVIRDVTLKVNPDTAFAIARGFKEKTVEGEVVREPKNKEPFATMDGSWVDMEPGTARALAQEWFGQPGVVQLGYNPRRRGQFYDRANAMPVSKADQIIQIGNFVLAKGVTYADPMDPEIMPTSASGEQVRFMRTSADATNKSHAEIFKKNQSESFKRKVDFVVDRMNVEFLSEHDPRNSEYSMAETYISNYLTKDPIADKEQETLNLTDSELTDLYRKDIKKVLTQDGVSDKAASTFIDYIYRLSNKLENFLVDLSESNNELAFTAKKLLKSKFNQEQVRFMSSMPVDEKRRNVDPGVPIKKASSWDRGIEAFNNKMVDSYFSARKVQKAIESVKGRLADHLNLDQALTLFPGKTREQVEDFVHAWQQPLGDLVRDSGLTFSEAAEFLHARHAKEANLVLKQRNPGKKNNEALSGMSNEDAQKILDKYKDNAAVQKIGKFNDLMSDMFITESVKSGLMSENEAASWRANSKHYVPLNRVDIDGPTGVSRSQGFDVRGRNAKLRVGSDRDVDYDNMFAHIMQQHITRIIRKNKNEVSKTLWNMAKDNPDPTLWETDENRFPEDVKRMLKESRLLLRLWNHLSETNEAALQGMNLQEFKIELRNLIAQGLLPDRASVKTLTDNRTASVLKALMDADTSSPLNSTDEVIFTEALDNLVKGGTISSSVNLNEINILSHKVNGENRYIWLNDRNEVGKKMARSMRNLDKGGIPKALQFIAKFNRLQSALITTFSPDFVFTNPIRDIQTAMYNMTDTQLDGFQKDVIRNLKASAAGIREALRGEGDSDMAALFNEMRREGGTVGWLDSHRDAAQYMKVMQRDMEGWTMGGVKVPAQDQIKGLMKFMEDYNTVFENAVRLSAYKVAKDNGLTKKQAAQIAKQLTVDFNQTGEWGPALNALYLFYNASIQGSARMLRASLDPRNKKARKLMYATIAAAAITDMMNRMLAEDEDEYNEMLDRHGSRNWLIKDMFGLTDDGYFKIPAPYGYNILVILGQELSAGVAHGMGMNQTWNPIWSSGRVIQTIDRMFSSRLFIGGVESFNPVNSGSLLEMVSPTVADPHVRIYTNRDWHGGPLYPNYSEEVPDYTKYYAGARSISVELAKWLYDNTHDHQTLRGGLDWSPEWIDMYYDFLVGGAGKFVVDAGESVFKLSQGDMPEFKRIPIARRFYTEIGAGEKKTGFYEKMYELTNMGVELDRIERTRTKEEYDDVRSKIDPERLKLLNDAKDARREVERYKKLMRIAEKNGDKERVKELDKKMVERMDKFSRKYNEKLYGVKYKPEP